MEPCYSNDWAPLDTILNSSRIDNNKASSKVPQPPIIINSSNNIIHKASFKAAAYVNSLPSMQKSAHADELELFRRLVVDGDATSSSSSSTPAFNMMPFTHHYPLSATPLAQLLSPSYFNAKPLITSSPKRSRDSLITLSDPIKEEEEEEEKKDGQKKGRKKVKSKMKKEQLNKIGEEEDIEEEREGGAQGSKGDDEKEIIRHGSCKETRGSGGPRPNYPIIKRAKASSTPSKQVLTKASSSHPPPPPPPPKKEVLLPSPPPKTDFIHVRARRGQATDSHSLAERVRREKISERMRFLQDLVPGCNKINGKAMMLDEIINYVQSLQHQVEFLAMKLAASHPKQFDINFDDIFIEEEIAFALSEVREACPNVVVQAMEPECPSYHMQTYDFPSFVNVRFCDDEDLPFISDVLTSNLI